MVRASCNCCFLLDQPAKLIGPDTPRTRTWPSCGPAAGSEGLSTISAFGAENPRVCERFHRFRTLVERRNGADVGLGTEAHMAKKFDPAPHDKLAEDPRKAAEAIRTPTRNWRLA